MPEPEDPSAVPYRFHAPREVRAGDLVLRRWQEDDLDDVFESVSASLEHLRPWMPWADGYDLEGAREFLARQAPRATPDGDEAVSDAGYSIRDASNRVVGSCGLHGRLGHGALEIGYWVDVRHTRRGIAKLAAALLTETAFALPDIERVEIHHDKANVASGRVPASLGFRHDATIVDEPDAPGEVGVEIQWTMTREAFPTSPAFKLLEDARGVRPSVGEKPSGT